MGVKNFIVSESLRTLLSQRHDAVIVIDGHEIKSNKILLSTYSLKLAQLISTDSTGDAIIPIKGHDIEDIQNMLQLLHEGHVTIDESKADKFNDSLARLQIVGCMEGTTDVKNNVTQTAATQTDPMKEEIQPSPPMPKINLLPKGDGKVLCVPCKKEYSCMYTAKRHIKTAHESTGKMFPCLACEKTFSNKPYLNAHLVKEHQITQKMLKNINEPIKAAKIKQEKNAKKAPKTLRNTKKIKKDPDVEKTVEAEEFGNMDAVDQ